MSGLHAVSGSVASSESEELSPNPIGDSLRGSYSDPKSLIRFALVGFVAVGAFLWTTVSIVALSVTPRDAKLQSYLDGPRVLDGWFHNDAAWYLGIADGGYSYTPGVQSPIAFFPAYPMLMRFVSPIFGGDTQFGGTVSAGLLGLLAVVLFAWWVADKLPARAARVSVALLLLYPYSFFLFGAVYADSVFIVGVIGAFLLVDRGHPILAGLLGVLATADRPVGIAIAAGLFVRTIELRHRAKALASDTGGSGFPQGRSRGGLRALAVRAEVDRPVALRTLLRSIRLLRPADFGVLLSLSGLVAWCWYLWAEFGDPLAWVAVQKAPGWNQGSGPHTWFKIVFLGTLVKGPVENVLLLVPQALVSAAAVLLLYQVWRRLGWGYFTYSFVLLFIAIVGTKDFMGDGRYVMSTFPAFAAAGSLLADPRRRKIMVTVMAVSAIGLGVAAGFFAYGWEVS